ncbi:chemotaxis protein CheA [Eshraghiella crossota]|uniref:Chemotaxis protein CheA n=1 Tax=Eshraghiella crossota DSM 2876 TaxID=511680 RepID=D4S185_9FIRM|nr:chemotaxis protein CheA [Butyrivibrio crossotus]EFF67975.1 CheW-like protein [Butyrivibrio crossotus DSM 2876]UWO51609.1 chemotaxis protein CheA [Butyrivibrio crossotus]
MDVSQYLEIFVEETKEHLQSLNDNILVLENEPENKDTINEIFRSAHSLKGMAGTMGYKRMQTLTHDMENVFSEIRNDKLKVTSDLVDILFQCLDALEAYLDNIINTQDEGTDDNAAIIKLLNDYLNGGSGVAEQAAPQAAQAAPQTADGVVTDFSKVNFADFEQHAIMEAGTKNLNVYGVHVKIDPSCILKAARAFLVFKSVEELGEIIKSIPSAQDIEDEKFDLDFDIFVITGESLDKVLATVRNVSEIKDAEGSIIKLDEKKEEKPEETEKTESAKPATVPKAGKPANSQPAKGKPVVNRSVRVDIDKLDVLMNLVSELIIAKNGLVSAAATSNTEENQSVNEQIEYLERVTTNLHESVMNVRMVPIETVVNRFPRMIRDLSKKLDKKMELYMTGEETELDRTVIDEIGDPLMHLLRNSADHGLESAEVRRERGKDEIGTIFLNAFQDGNNVVIEVGDDGNGIDIEKVKSKAIERGTITPEQAEVMSDKEVIDLLFLPSFSTSEKITDVSGRGVGLDVVKSKIESLGGVVECKSVLGEGSTFTIRLPLTLAIIQALMVKLGNEQYAIALGSIQTIEDIPLSDIKYVQGKEVINLRGNIIPIIRLGELLDVPDRTEPDESLIVVVIKKGDKQAGLVVDSLVGQMEIVIKSLGKYININKMISGATILGDGEVALIIDANAII